MAAEFIRKSRGFYATNFQRKLSIEKFLTKSEEAFFDKVKEGKRSGAASLRPQHDSFYHGFKTRTHKIYERRSCGLGVATGIAARNGAGGPDARGVNRGYYRVSRLIRSAHFTEAHSLAYQRRR